MQESLDSLGPYKIVQFLARGGMGELYVAVDPARPEQEVVLKCVRALERLDRLKGPIRMFLDEARVATLIDHPNVVRVHTVDYESGVYYLVMEKLEGLDLGCILTHLARSKELIPLRIVARLMIEACHGLHAAHECVTERGEAVELVHRDISPTNLFVTTEGVMKILDFGVAKTTIQTAETQVGHIKGKASYMSPEQARGGSLDRRSDIFSLGIVLHEVLTGRRLFSRTAPLDALRAVLDELIPPPSRADEQIGDALQGVTMRALQRDRNLRFSTALEFAAALERVVPEAAQVEAAEVAAIIADVRPTERDPTSTVSVAHGNTESLERWAVELTCQISKTTTSQGRGTLQNWATQIIRTNHASQRISQRLRTPLGLAVTACVLFGSIIGLSVGTAALGGEDFASATDRTPAIAGTAALAPPNTPPPEDTTPAYPRADAADSPTAEPPSTRRSPAATRSSRRATRPEPRPRKARAESDRPAPVGTGRLTLEADPWANVYLGDKLLGATPLVERKLPAGPVTLRLVNPETGQRQRLTLDIPAGGLLRHGINLE